MNAPCYGCQDRKPDCHAKCAAYKSYRAEMDAFAKYIAENKPIDAMRDPRNGQEEPAAEVQGRQSVVAPII